MPRSSFVKLPGKFPLLPRKKNTHKGHYGHTLVLAGSKGMMGAAILTAEAALRSGSGLVTLAVPEGLQKFTAELAPEIMRLILPCTKEGSFGAASFKKIKDFARLRKVSAVALGPGLSQNKETALLVRKLVRDLSQTMILDADGLNSFKDKQRLLGKPHTPLILTPHAGEFERLFKIRIPEKELLRIELAKKLSKFYHVVLVLKAHRTLVVSDSLVYKNNTGNPGMAKGGSGDVLTGIIASFVSQKISLFLASVWGVYFHGLAADLAVRETGQLSLTASDIIKKLPQAFLKHRNTK